MTEIGKHIKALRKKQGMSQKDLAAAVFTTRQTISNYETGRSTPDIDTIEKLAKALDTDLPSLLYGEGTAPEPKKNTLKKYTAAIVVLGVSVFLLFRLLELSGLIHLFLFDRLKSEVQVSTDVSEYSSYMGETAQKEYRSKYGVEESVFPRAIPDSGKVKDYKMVYYNPWDPQYLSYLLISYDQEGYREETNRLKNLPLQEYRGIFGAKGFAEGYQLLAMCADPDHGFVYALADGSDAILYVEILFGNYFMDLDYETYIDPLYLPVGFDASPENPYRKQRLSSR